MSESPTAEGGDRAPVGPPPALECVLLDGGRAVIRNRGVTGQWLKTGVIESLESRR